MSHTKGPWRYHLNGDGSYTILGEKISEKESKWIIGFIQNGEITLPQQLENVKLIAAAPEMLKVLEAIVRNETDWRSKNSPALSDFRFNEIKEIIKKATE